MPALPRRLNKDQLSDLIWVWAKEKNKLPKTELINLGSQLGYSLPKIQRLIENSPDTDYYRGLLQLLSDT